MEQIVRKETTNSVIFDFPTPTVPTLTTDNQTKKDPDSSTIVSRTRQTTITRGSNQTSTRYSSTSKSTSHGMSLTIDEPTSSGMPPTTTVASVFRTVSTDLSLITYKQGLDRVKQESTFDFSQKLVKTSSAYFKQVSEEFQDCS